MFKLNIKYLNGIMPIHLKLKTFVKFYSNLKKDYQTHCNILGVRDNATKEEIKEAYYKLAKKYHPDTGNKLDNNSHSFTEIKASYEEIMKSFDSVIKQCDNKLNPTGNNVEDILDIILKPSKKENHSDKNKNKINKLFYPVGGIKIESKEIELIRECFYIRKKKEMKKQMKIKKIQEQNKLNINFSNCSSESIISDMNKKGSHTQNQNGSFTSNAFVIVSKFFALSVVSSFFLLFFGKWGILISLYIIILSFK
jgi:hypothetical protein